MRSTITLNGINSNTIEGLLIQNLPPISKPLMRTQIEEIDGRDGDVITKLGFSAYNKEITIGLYGDFDINQIIQYFTSQGTVVFSNEPDKYYYYQIIDQIDFERLIRYRTATVTMHCQPFKYSTTEGTQVFDNSSNLLTIPNSTTTTNGVTVTANNNILTISGTASAATEFYIPIDTLSLSVGKYGMYALGSGTNPEACSLRVIYNSPSNANSFGGNYVTLKNNQTVSLIANLSNAKTYNYVYLYIAANKAMDFTLNLSIEDAAQSVVTGEGNLITLEGTAFAPFDKFDLKGDTTQQTYSGKNLLNVDSSYTISNIYQTKSISLASGGTYTLQIDNMTTNGSGESYITIRGNGNTLKDTYISNTNKSYTFTLTANADEMYIYADKSYSSSQGKTTTFTNMMISMESSITQYEPYVGGIPAPNPNYPQPVQVVTGEQTVTITDGDQQSQEYKVNLGKNLLDQSTMVQGNFSYIDNYESANADRIRSPFFPCEPNTTYTLSLNVPIGEIGVIYKDSGGNLIQGFGRSVDNTSYTFTTKAGAYQMRVRVGNATYSKTAGTDYNIQVEKGSTATTYAPYFTPIELCKIGTYQDYIYKSESNWYIHKDLSKVVIAANDITLQTNYTNIEYGKFSKPNDYKGKGNYGAHIVEFTHAIFSNANSNWDSSDKIGYIFATPDTSYMWVGFTKGTGLDNVKAKLTGAEMYYPLATPTDTQITDSSVIAQLEALVTDAHAYKNTTTLVSTSQQLPHIMSVEVAKNNDATITNSGNTTAKPVMTVYGSGTVGIYLNGNQIFNVNIGNNQYITIDTANMEAYKDTTDNLMNRLVDGDYSNFVLQTGENQISFSGSVSKLEISNYSRWI